MTVDAAAQPSRRPRERLLRTAGKFTIVNAIVSLSALLTGPLQARALGPAGRGELAAILVPLAIAPVIAELGLGTYASVQAARGRNLGRLVGTVATLMVVLGAIGAAVGLLLTDRLAEGRDTVALYLTIGFCLMPLSALLNLVVGLNSGLERWNAVLTIRLILPVGTALIFLVLYVADALTVASAATVAIVLSIVAALAGLGAFRGMPKLRFDRAIARQGFSFGLKVWTTSIAAMTNARLDQLLMVTLVSSKDLGYYAVAVTYGTLPSIVSRTVAGPLLPRVAGGDEAITRCLNKPPPRPPLRSADPPHKGEG